MIAKIVAGDEAADENLGGKVRCVQRAGDVIVVPARWGHITYNLQASVGLAKEFTSDPLSKHRFKNLDPNAAKEFSAGRVHLRVANQEDHRIVQEVDNHQEVDVPILQTAKVKVLEFISAVEDDGMPAEEAERIFLEGRSPGQVMAAVTAAAKALAPTAVRIAATSGGGVCASATDDAVALLFKAYSLTSDMGADFFNMVNEALLQGKIVSVSFKFSI